ncbi:GNAT family N-acetyltransferase [Pseudarthrobacter sp. J75]|uniref:GNAT family N-acetyltransferase n=1 Tax=unclassified Pseudarthrobacter TaxID=2647000 RepID=UPI002E8116B2|nr:MULTISPECIES: GNAT family N-acetyltransferase [unclassified Pseudarthrobacter]MEE2524173.1 GNAT family N-acetyltransferase [Pseudarthrobacter sp. J47]MEE2530211.1 GNAT family N-acetyltransferase [Pseudarthrobacter sp. J75]
MNALAPTARRPVYEEELELWGALRIVDLNPDADAETVHAWVSEERARFWGMLGKPVEEVRDIYRFVDSLDTHHAFLVLLDGEPVALFQTYEPLEDPVSEVYPARAEDIGMHLLLAPPSLPRPRFTPRLVGALINFMFSDPAIDRIVVEPDARNAKALQRLEATCFDFGPVVQLAEKEAQLAFLTRERYAAAPFA